MASISTPSTTSRCTCSVLLLSPAAKAAEYLKALARVSRILKNETTRQDLLASSSAEAIVTLFEAGPPGF